jgi:crotonobetainyl-CoA:carnitine CoA-transferase CaiB-like acyl-CoA transferase
MVNIPIRLSETPGGLRRPAPLLGQHTDEVLGELGYDAAQVQQMREAKVVG